MQFDKFEKADATSEDYAAKAASQSVNGWYFDAAGTLYSSGACFMATDRGMRNILRAYEEWRPGPMDGYLTMNGNRVALAKKNLAVQVALADAMVFDYMKANTHHRAYAPQGVRAAGPALRGLRRAGRLRLRIVDGGGVVAFGSYVARRSGGNLAPLRFCR